MHVEPWLDPEVIEDLWYFDDEPWYRQSPGEVKERLDRNFAATHHRLTFIGHFHRWLLATPGNVLPWEGGGPVVLEPDRRRLIIVNAVVEGWCALFDTGSNLLTPLSSDAREGDLPGTSPGSAKGRLAASAREVGDAVSVLRASLLGGSTIICHVVTVQMAEIASADVLAARGHPGR